MTPAFSPPASERLAGLADRCEAASGPDRILDYEIRAAIRGAPLHKPIVKVTREGWETVHYEGGGVSQGSEPRAYTASLDAAMSLVPEGVESRPLSFKVEHFYLGNGICQSHASVWDGLGIVSPLDTASVAATPALALCAASLRARIAGAGQ